MTNQNNAARAAIRSVLTEAEHNRLLNRANYPHLQEDPRAYLIKITEELVLSRLRAPVADERAAFETYQKGAGLDELYLERNATSGHYMWTATKEAWETWQARAALASAPVAGEAQRSHLNVLLEHAAERLADAGMGECASIVRGMKVPNDGRKTEALNAAPQAREAQCSCPSGDGSLRHPCAVHPASEGVRDAAFEAVRKRLCALPRYSFWIGDNGGVKRVEDRSGDWIDFDAAHELFDPVCVDAALSAQPAKEPANPKPSAAGNPGAADVSDNSKTGAAQEGDRHA